MNVLVVSQYFWPEPVRVNDLAVGLVERGHRVTVLTGTPNYPGGSFYPGYGLLRPLYEDYRGMGVLRIPLVPRGTGRRHLMAINYLSFAVTASLLGPLLCRGRFDVILVYQPSPITVGIPAIVMKKIKGAPIMFWVQDLWPETLSATGAIRSKRILSLVARVVRYIYRRCDRILVQSKGFVPRVKALGARPASIIYFPNWADELYRPVELEDGAPEREEMPGGFRVVYAGNIGAAQGFDTVLAAAEKLKDHSQIQWMILGDGSMRSWVEERIKELRIENSVHLLGRRPVESMPRYLSLADALLITLRPDLLFSLTIPSKLQSYLACGRPLVAAIDGEVARVVEEAGAGAAVPAGDAEALAAAVLDLARFSPEERVEMGRRGRAYFEEHFEREKLLDRLEGWMDELVGGRS